MSDSPPTDNPIDLELEKLKIHSDSKPVEFMHLTVAALNLIIEKSQLKERLILRKVSRSLRDLVDDQKSILTEIGFECHFDHIRANFNSNIVVYADEVECRKFESQNRFRDAKVIRCYHYFWEALEDLECVIKDPNLQLDVLRVEFFWGLPEHFSEKIKTILKSLNHKISTKTFEIRAESADHILAILPCLKPGTLHCIGFRQRWASWDIYKEDFDEIAELEQWKQAKQLVLEFACDMWPEEHLMHFEEFYIFDWCLSAEDIRKWRDFFTKSKNFIACQIDTEDGFYERRIQDHIGDREPTLPTDRHSNRHYVIKHPILYNLKQYLEIKVWPVHNCIILEKVACQSF